MPLSEVTLGQAIDFFNGKSIKPGQEGEFPAYGANGVIGGATDWKYRDAIIIGRVGAYCGSVAYCKNRFWASDNTIVAKPKTEQGDVKYFYYLLKNLGLNKYAGGAAQPLITQTVLKAVPARIADFPTQHRIASILSAYDDLIENNTRRISILEEMARRIYEEWFVHFRFPGHEKVRMVESELGLIPEGWEVCSLGDLIAINAKSVRTTRTIDEILYIDIASVSPGTIEQKQPFIFKDAPGRARRVVSHGDVIWSCVRPNRRSFALVLNPEANLIASTGFAVLSAQRIPYSYLYFTVTTDAFVGYLTNHATGAAYPAVTASTFEAAMGLKPHQIITDQFHSLVAPMLDLSELLKRKNTNLRTTRDLLLPKLISGEIDVSNFPESKQLTA